MKQVYRHILHQARLLSHTFEDDTILVSHRYVARANLAPLVQSPAAASASPAELARSRRLAKATRHARQLADANVGWPHAVERALWVAYGRRGKLRRDALGHLSPPRSESSDTHLPRELRYREIPPLLATLLTHGDTMRGTPSKPAHIQRPPPPYLPPAPAQAGQQQQQQQVRLHLSRRRDVNARQKWLRTQMKKVILPIDVVGGARIRDLERRAAPLVVGTGTGTGTGRAGAGAGAGAGAHLDRARRDMMPLSTGVRAQRMRRASIRAQGWAKAPVDYAERPRARRRMYARLLEVSPVLALTPTPTPVVTKKKKKKKNDPIGLRGQIEAWSQATATAATGRITRSRHAISRRSPRAAQADARSLSEQEVAFLQSVHLLS